MKRFVIVWLMLLVMVTPSWALEDYSELTMQSAAASTSNGTEMTVNRFTTVTLQVTISDTATITFEGSGDGTNYVSHACTSISNTSGTLVTTATASAVYQCNVAGLKTFRARISSYSAGTVTVTARASTAIFSKKSSGGGGAATMTIGGSTVTGGNASSILYTDGGPTLQQLSGTGLVLSNGVSAPSIYGGVTCTNQVLRVLSAVGGGTCITITSAYVDSSILVNGGALGTPSSATLTNATGLPIAGITGLGTGVGTFLATPSSANLMAAVTGETGTGGGVVFATAPTIDSPVFTTKQNLAYGTAFPGSPATGDVIVITDDSAAGACDSAAGSSVSICRYTGAAWAAIGDGGSGSSAFSSITSATNTTATMTLGTGGTLTFSGSGVVNANQYKGNAIVAVADGGHGAAPASDDQVFVASSTTAGAWKSVADCQDAGGNHLNYTASTNSFSCGTSASAGTNSYTVATISASGAISGTHKAYKCDATAGAVAITLPAASAVSGADFAITKIDSSANACTITRAGADTIWGATTLVLAAQNVAATVVADGTSTWLVY